MRILNIRVESATIFDSAEGIYRYQGCVFINNAMVFVGTYGWDDESAQDNAEQEFIKRLSEVLQAG